MNSLFLLSFSFLLCVFSTKCLHAQYHVRGRAIDSIKQIPLPFASIQIRANAQAEKPLLSTTADDKGEFSILLAAGTYLIDISYAGYQKDEFALALAGSQWEVDLGSISLHPGPHLLNAAEVTSRKPLYGFAPGMISYDSKNDPRSIGKNAYDLLRQAPLVSISGSGAITLKGRSDFLLQLDGKSVQALSVNPETFLRSFDQTQIDHIEVITIPSAKYSAEGVTGIINIVTRKSRVLGNFGTLTIGSDTYSSSFLALALAGRAGKFGYSLNASGSLWRNGRYEYDLTNEIQSKTTTVTGQTTPKRNNGNGFASISYEANKNNILTVDLSTFLGNGNIQQRFFDQNKDLETVSHLKNDNYSISANWQHTFDSLCSLVLSYKIESQHNNSNIQSTGSPTTIADTGLSLENSAQADFKYKNFETGATGIFRSLKSTISPQHQTFDFTQGILAAYVNYTRQIDVYNLQLGFRDEYTSYQGVTTDSTFLDTQYNELFPNVTVDRNFLKENIEFSLGYSRRISRPQLYYLNPFLNTSNPYTLSTGNTQLTPELVDNLELRITKQDKRSNSYILTLSYESGSNSICTFAYPQNDSAITTSYVNFRRQYLYGISFYANLTLFKVLAINLSENLYWTKYPANNIKINETPAYVISRSGTFGSFGADLSATLWKKVRWSFTNTYNLPDIFLQGHGTAFFYQDMTISIPMAKNRLRVYASVRQPFLGSYSYRTYYGTSAFTGESSNITPQRRGFFGLSYSFGKPRRTNIHTRTNIDNSDKKDKNTLDTIK